MSPLIPYPNVPNYPGVPPVPRTAPGQPQINVNLQTIGIGSDLVSTAEPLWGIVEAGSTVALYTPTEGGTLSVYTFGQTRPTQVSDFPIEASSSGQGAAFASFNKVWQPANPVVVLALSGTDSEKQQFLAAVDDACASTDLWDVYTPDATYKGYTVERYTYQRSATHGASLLTVEVSLKQILQVTAAYTNTPVNSPQSPSAQNPVNNGINQPSIPSSYLSNWFGQNAGNTVGVGGPG